MKSLLKLVAGGWLLLTSSLHATPWEKGREGYAQYRIRQAYQTAIHRRMLHSTQSIEAVQRLKRIAISAKPPSLAVQRLACEKLKKAALNGNRFATYILYECLDRMKKNPFFYYDLSHTRSYARYGLSHAFIEALNSLPIEQWRERALNHEHMPLLDVQYRYAREQNHPSDIDFWIEKIFQQPLGDIPLIYRPLFETQYNYRIHLAQAIVADLHRAAGSSPEPRIKALEIIKKLPLFIDQALTAKLTSFNSSHLEDLVYHYTTGKIPGHPLSIAEPDIDKAEAILRQMARLDLFTRSIDLPPMLSSLSVEDKIRLETAYYVEGTKFGYPDFADLLKKGLRNKTLHIPMGEKELLETLRAGITFSLDHSDLFYRYWKAETSHGRQMRTTRRLTEEVFEKE